MRRSSFGDREDDDRGIVGKLPGRKPVPSHAKSAIDRVDSLIDRVKSGVNALLEPIEALLETIDALIEAIEPLLEQHGQQRVFGHASFQVRQPLFRSPHSILPQDTVVGDDDSHSIRTPEFA